MPCSCMAYRISTGEDREVTFLNILEWNGNYRFRKYQGIVQLYNTSINEQSAQSSLRSRLECMKRAVGILQIGYHSLLITL